MPYVAQELEYEVSALEGRAGLEQVRGSANIVMVIFDGVDVRFANICIGSEVHNPQGFQVPNT